MEEELFDLPLELDAGGLEQRGGEAIVADERLTLLTRENRLGLRKGRTTRLLLDDGATAALDLPLQCVAHAHPECRFRWVRMVVDFGPAEGALIRDMSPREVVGAEPMKIVTKHSGGLSFEVEKFKLGPEFSFEKSTEHEIYFPEITSSGVGFTAAYWNFQAPADEELHVDRALRLLVTHPAASHRLEAKFTLRARVAMKGMISLIPLVGRRQAVVESFESLT